MTIMDNISVNLMNEIGKIKPMHAVNNGPLKPRSDQTKSNFTYYKDAEIPYARNHDAGHWPSAGGKHAVDISGVFPDFNADVNDPASYDFILTDVYLASTIDAGTKIFYRLGESIEHWVKKYNIYPPKDYRKWAEICEHIIMHYTEGWADGYYWDIEYWEIWNEPDLNEHQEDKKTWTGTMEEFYELYVVAATHLKKRFPHLKIGGPAATSPYAEIFLENMLKRLTRDGERVPMDFYSWHLYLNDPKWLEGSEIVRNLLDKYGYNDTESILNEWNYVIDWSDNYIKSIEEIISIRGAAFTAACMLESQKRPIDMLMYYDARPSAFNGLFDFYTDRPLKGYYPFKMFANLYKKETECICDIGEVKAIAAQKNGKAAVMITHYSPNNDGESKEIEVSFDRAVNANVFILDKEHDAEKLFGFSGQKINIMIPPDCVVLISEDYNE